MTPGSLVPHPTSQRESCRKWDRIGERIRASKRAQKERGEYLGGKPPFGWRSTPGGGLVVDHQQQQALSRMRALRAGGASLRAVAARLTAEGTPVSHEGVKKILAAARAC